MHPVLAMAEDKHRAANKGLLPFTELLAFNRDLARQLRVLPGGDSIHVHRGADNTQAAIAGRCHGGKHERPHIGMCEKSGQPSGGGMTHLERSLVKHGRTPGIGTVGSVVTSSGRRAQGSPPGRGRRCRPLASGAILRWQRPPHWPGSRSVTCPRTVSNIVPKHVW